jgi:hypothetical protein
MRYDFRVRVPYDIRKRSTLSSNFCSCNNRKILLVKKIISSTFTDPCKLLICRSKGKQRIQGMFPQQNILGSLELRIVLTLSVATLWNGAYGVHFTPDIVMLPTLDCSNPTRTTDSHLKRIISTNC